MLLDRGFDANAFLVALDRTGAALLVRARSRVAPVDALLYLLNASGP